MPAVKFPELSRLTIVDAVFELVAAFASSSALCIFAADDVPTKATVVAKDEVPEPVTSEVNVMVWSPVFVPERLDPVTDPDADIASAVRVPVKVGLALNTTFPLPVVPETVVP